MGLASRLGRRVEKELDEALPCKHKFEARYDETYANPLDHVIEMQKEALLQGCWGGEIQGNFTPYLKYKTYIHDICVKCGKIVKC
jgi:hypothetical protein